MVSHQGVTEKKKQSYLSTVSNEDVSYFVSFPGDGSSMAVASHTIVTYDIAIVLKWPRRFLRIVVLCCECACISTGGPSSGKNAAWEAIPEA